MTIEVFIEAEGGSREKGLYDESTLERGGMRTALLPYPYPYGFILGTKTEDRDAVDCYVITSERPSQGAIMECEPIGLLEMREDGEVDHKVLARPLAGLGAPGRGAKADEALRAVLNAFIKGIFAVYPEVRVEIGSILPAEAALELIERSRVR